jgi:hypothetical protein
LLFVLASILQIRNAWHFVTVAEANVEVEQKIEQPEEYTTLEEVEQQYQQQEQQEQQVQQEQQEQQDHLISFRPKTLGPSQKNSRYP